MLSLQFRHKRQVTSLESVVLSDRAMYRCVVRNRYGSINHTHKLDAIGMFFYATERFIEGWLLQIYDFALASSTTSPERLLHLPVA